MGLQLTLSLKSGLTATDAYIRVDNLQGNKNGITYVLLGYNSQTGYAAGNEPLYQDTLSFTPSVDDDATNFIKQAYVYAKTLSKYSSATDC